jgi:uncharacterized membrane protein YebE (DUF533 family)
MNQHFKEGFEKIAFDRNQFSEEEIKQLKDAAGDPMEMAHHVANYKPWSSLAAGAFGAAGGGLAGGLGGAILGKKKGALTGAILGALGLGAYTAKKMPEIQKKHRDEAKAILNIKDKDKQRRVAEKWHWGE